jgi:hypothetical protein
MSRKRGREMMDEQRVLHEPFDLETHKKTFFNYLEVIISDDGTIMYAVPSHQEKLIILACQKLNVTKEELYEFCPKEYYFDIMNWLCQVSNCIALWNEHMVGTANEKQNQVVSQLAEEKLYHGTVLA